MKITVVGGGYVGLVTAACFADLDHIVKVVNRDPKKTAAINAGNSPIYEQGLDQLLSKNIRRTLSAVTGYDRIGNSDLVFICVGTPCMKDGSADLSMVRSACLSLGKTLKNSESSPVVVVKSTVPPGTTTGVVRPIILKSANRSDIGFAMNPEFLREGRAVEDFFNPDRIVIGSDSPSAFETVASAYKGIKAPILQTSLPAAEMIKYTSNAFLATKISFANEIGNICKQIGIDVYEVMKGVGLDHRISPHFLNAGAGFGGSCFPKDTSALIHLASELGEDPCLLRSVMEVNERQPMRLISLLERKIGDLKGKRIAVLGLAFKDNTDDIRDSRSIIVLGELLKKGAQVTAFDPLAMSNMRQLFPEVEYCITAEKALCGSDGCLVLTEWPEFLSLSKEFDLMRGRVIIEGRRILSCKDSEGICW
jgi:UDPglucose 6-dehydrogenase